MLHSTESPQTVQRRGRWASARVMEIYLQEVLVTTFTQRLRPQTREQIHFYASGFSSLIQQSILFLNAGIPTKAWFWLLKAASGLEQDTERRGEWSFLTPNCRQLLAVWLMQPLSMAAKWKGDSLKSRTQPEICGAQAPRPPMPVQLSGGRF